MIFHCFCHHQVYVYQSIIQTIPNQAGYIYQPISAWTMKLEPCRLNKGIPQLFLIFDTAQLLFTLFPLCPNALYTLPRPCIDITIIMSPNSRINTLIQWVIRWNNSLWKSGDWTWPACWWLTLLLLNLLPCSQRSSSLLFQWLLLLNYTVSYGPTKYPHFFSVNITLF